MGHYDVSSSPRDKHTSSRWHSESEGSKYAKALACNDKVLQEHFPPSPCPGVLSGERSIRASALKKSWWAKPSQGTFPLYTQSCITSTRGVYRTSSTRRVN